MQADPRQASRAGVPLEPVRDQVRVQRPAVQMREHQPGVHIARPNSSTLRSLPGLVLPERRDCRRVKAGPAGGRLRRPSSAGSRPPVGNLPAAAAHQLPEVGPDQPHRFGLPQHTASASRPAASRASSQGQAPLGLGPLRSCSIRSPSSIERAMSYRFSLLARTDQMCSRASRNGCASKPGCESQPHSQTVVQRPS
jgi:hypothetical protein